MIQADPDLQYLDYAKTVLVPALGENETWQQVIDGLESSYAQLWVVIDGRPIAAAVTELGDGEAHFWLAGGVRAAEWADSLARGVCRLTGMKSATIRGRIGWARLLGWPIVERDGKNAFMRMEYE